MGFIELADLGYRFPGGTTLFEGATFKVREGRHAALVGANGVGKTTLLRILAGEETASTGTSRVVGRVGYMPQLVGSIGGAVTVAEFLLSLAPEAVREAGVVLAEAEEAVRLPHGRVADLRYADALAAWSDVGGYEYEVAWDVCTTEAFGLPLEGCRDRPMRMLSGGEQKRLALEALLRSACDVLLLDEPDNFLDVDGKRWLEEALNASRKTVLYVSHDRELLARTAHRVVTLEGHGAWTHDGSFETYAEARQARLVRLDSEHRRWREEHDRLVGIMKEFKRRAATSDVFASRAKAAESRLERFRAEERPPERPDDQRVDIRLDGGRTAKRALAVRGLGVPEVFEPFDCEIWFGERVGVVGPNGSGKSHFLKVLAGEGVRHTGEAVLGSRVVPGYFSQVHDVAELRGSIVSDVLGKRGLDRQRAMRLLHRYEMRDVYFQPFETLSGGQQARLQILLLEVAGATMLLLDEPTDNLDLVSAEALTDALEVFDGTVLAVTHDRWFLRAFDRFLVFTEDGSVRDELARGHDPAARSP